MSTSGNPGDRQYMNPAGGVAGQALAALPPDIQSLLKPGKTSERIQHAIAWAARRDPRVLAMHQRLDSSIKTFDDIRRASLANKDNVARDIARRYRHRAAATGAVTSLPGGLWAIVAAGADVQLTAAYSVRMASMISQAYGYDASILEEQAHLADVLALVAGIDGLRGVGNWLTREGLTARDPRGAAEDFDADEHRADPGAGGQMDRAHHSRRRRGGRWRHRLRFPARGG